MKIDYDYKNMIKATFVQNKYETCEWGSDQMGEYFRYSYGVATNFFWYPEFDAIFERWEQKLKDIPDVRFRDIHSGYDSDKLWRQCIMEKDGKYYLIRGATVRFGSDKAGPRGVNVYRFSFSNHQEDSLIKTERSLKVMLNKIDITPL